MTLSNQAGWNEFMTDIEELLKHSWVVFSILSAAWQTYHIIWLYRAWPNPEDVNGTTINDNSIINDNNSWLEG